MTVSQTAKPNRKPNLEIALGTQPPDDPASLRLISEIASILSKSFAGESGPRSELTRMRSALFHALENEAVRQLEVSVAIKGVARPPVVHMQRRRLIEPIASLNDLDCLQIEDWAGPVAGQTFLEKQYLIPRSTLHWWQRRNEIVALRKGARKHVFPLAQFVDCRPVAGLKSVLDHFLNARSAWLWLIQPSAALGDRVPLEMLRQDYQAEVMVAAQEVLPRS